MSDDATRWLAGGQFCFSDSLDAASLIGFADPGSSFMHKIFSRVASTLLVLISSSVAFADDFKSLTIPGFTDSGSIRVHNNQFMVIRNFTQEDGSIRGVVLVTTPPGASTSVNVLTATLLNMFTLEPINNVVIAGPADVVFACGDTTGNCFVSYKKDNN